MTDPKLQAAYEACAREPIHLSGAIQPHGALLAFAPRTGAIAAASDNAGDLFGTTAQALLDQPIDEWFDAHALELIRAGAAASQPGDFPRLAGLVNAGAWGELHHLSVHVRAQLIHVELEPAARESADPLDAHAMIARLEAGAQTAPFFHAVAEQVRALTGYDRVMVYAFRHDHSGEVVAQALGGELSSYLGLRFPASDIPPQARALYLANRVRVIPDAGYTPVPVRTAAHAAPLDMSFDVLRSVSPIHLEYLRNMGVRASMSISLIVDGRLWGLIACHHPQPRAVGPRERIAADVFGRYVSLLLGTRNLKQIGAAEAAARLHRHRLEQALAHAPSPFAALREQPEALLGALAADGAALIAGDDALLAGAELDPTILAPALAWARTHARHAAAGTAERADWNAADHGPAGLFAAPLDAGAGGWLLLFRNEQVEHVRWAGSPADAYQLDAGRLTIGPRTSFAEWNQTVRGTAEPWSEEDAERAERLRLMLSRHLPASAPREAAHGETGGRLVRLDLHGHRRRLQRLANLLADAADHLDASQRTQLDEAIAAMEAALAVPADAGRRAAG
ncbi:Bacteriophytochrome (light-regulated signal transduction histidine kinase) [Lysobacter sp. yr284]|uniref:GAF domain-containing protein n=1 Tax=Lysobacter sp. yr284 TaxID=1761791 RepID=UPI000896CFBE|nr:GAF domain-containing protein [Lysobacter sp. yr284]SDZ28947.1 Bacteriophytochrome (light-regulated signal transduction histidine kinase) [Lysobacter sp. yr284]